MMFPQKINTITVTFGDVAENGNQMQQIGSMANKGFSYEELISAMKHFEDQGTKCNLIDLNQFLSIENVMDKHAYILIIRGGLNVLLNKPTNNLYQELNRLDWDKKELINGKVLNKIARHNLCFADFSQSPDYNQGKGRIVSFDDLEILGHVRNQLQKIMKKPFFVAEGNNYYDSSKTSINFHGDRERKLVFAIRLGCSMPLYFHWFKDSRPVGSLFQTTLHHGDCYIMSEKAVGTDCLKKDIFTLRHAAGPKNVILKSLEAKKKKSLTGEQKTIPF